MVRGSRPIKRKGTHVKYEDGHVVIFLDRKAARKEMKKWR